MFLLIPLTAIIIFSGVFDFDNNPDHFEYKGKVGFIMNKSGKELYQTRLKMDLNNETYAGTILNSGRIYDTDNDGVNEILLSNGIQTLEESNSNVLRIICYDKDLNTRWQYSFKKVVSTSYEQHTDSYDLELEDSLTIDGELNIFCIARNSLTEVSALFRLNSRTGKLQNDILWHSGHLNTVRIFRYDNEDELYATAINNGFERSVIFSIPVNKLNGQLPAAEGYQFLKYWQSSS